VIGRIGKGSIPLNVGQMRRDKYIPVKHDIAEFCWYCKYYSHTANTITFGSNKPVFLT